MRRRHVDQTTEKPFELRHDQSMIVHPNRMYMGTVTAEQKGGALIAGILDGNAGFPSSVEEDAREQIECPLNARGDHDLIGIRLDAARRPQMVGDCLAQRAEPARIAILGLNTVRKGQMARGGATPKARRKTVRVRASDKEVKPRSRALLCPKLRCSSGKSWILSKANTLCLRWNGRVAAPNQNGRIRQPVIDEDAGLGS